MRAFNDVLVYVNSVDVSSKIQFIIAVADDSVLEFIDLK